MIKNNLISAHWYIFAIQARSITIVATQRANVRSRVGRNLYKELLVSQ